MAAPLALPQLDVRPLVFHLTAENLVKYHYLLFRMNPFMIWKRLRKYSAYQESPKHFCVFLLAGFAYILLLVAPVHARKAQVLSDEDILNPNKLVFDRTIPLIDSFDRTQIGTVFVSKRSIFGHPTKGVFGESCKSCPYQAEEIDASYIYVFQKKGECVIGVRGIGWGLKAERYVDGKAIEVGRIRHQSSAANISEIFINGVRVGPPTNLAQLGPPSGTNSKYFPRLRKNIARSIWISLNHLACGLHSTLKNPQLTSPDNCEIHSPTNEGYITDIHYFPAHKLIEDARQGYELMVQLPNWQPSRHLISGRGLAELRKLTTTCDSD
jgi:hypothetical protein